jgi:hypothetical protein
LKKKNKQKSIKKAMSRQEVDVYVQFRKTLSTGKYKRWTITTIQVPLSEDEEATPKEIVAYEHFGIVSK